MRKKKQGTRNSGQWTEGRFNAFIKSLLRAGSLRWGPRYESLKRAFIKNGINPSTGRKCKLHKCSGCSSLLPASKLVVDHIIPVVDPVSGFTNWHDYIERLFCEVDNFQVLCSPCHHQKTNKETALSCGKTTAVRTRVRVRKI